MTDDVGASYDQPTIRVHRLGMDHGPENTTYAQKRCLSTTADWVVPVAYEFDVRTTADGERVVLHDETLDRTTTGTGSVKDYTYEKLRDIAIPNPDGEDQYIPTLQEVLEIFAEHRGGYDQINVEAKEPELVDDIIYDVSQVEERTGEALLDDVVIHSFLVEPLVAAGPEVDTCLAASTTDELLTKLEHYGDVDFISIPYDEVSKPFVQDMAAQGYKVDIWGEPPSFDDDHAFTNLINYELGLEPDVIGTNRPQYAYRHVRQGQTDTVDQEALPAAHK